MKGSVTRGLLGFGMAALTGLTSLAAAEAVVEGRTAQDRRYIAGGIGLDESEQMKAAARSFPLAITVASKSGAYLADSHIRIEDAQAKVVLDTMLKAPYLLVDLAPGKYKVEATLQGKRQTRSVDITAKVPAKIVFAFDVPADR
ncbi:MAG: carboxypeptidase regulatory-like domain-containing protein, partial [Burkholderiaceae bacterium]